MFNLVENSITRSNGYKLVAKRFQTDIAKNYFTYSIVNEWNSLPSHVVNAIDINMFKNRLDKEFKSRGKI